MKHLWPVADKLEAIRRGQAAVVDIGPVVEDGGWPRAYVNADTGKPYEPHHEEEREFVESDSPRVWLVKGGEGAGKSVAGVIKDLERLRRGMFGIMVSPDFEHFKKSLWKEFARWCPWEMVIPEHRYRSRAGWEPSKPFTLTFLNRAELICGGIEEPGAWEGPNVHFFHFDEPRRHKTAAALKVLAGRIRLTGPNGEPPQGWLTTTPKKHWLFDYFGPPLEDEPDPHEAFKRSSRVITLRTSDNQSNLDPDYERERRGVLTESEARVLMDAEWEDIEDATRFLDSILWWDACKEDLPPLDKQTPLVLALDGAYAARGDVFGGVAVSGHPSKADAVAVRAVMAWEAKGEPRDFEQIQDDVKNFCLDWNVLQIAYDPTQLVQMMQHLSKPSKTIGGRDFPGVLTSEFNQGVDRLAADKSLLDLIVSRLIAHDGDAKLRKHLDNADKKTADGKKLRIVKRTDSLKIDLAVCASMAVARVQELPLTPAVPAANISRPSPYRSI